MRTRLAYGAGALTLLAGAVGGAAWSYPAMLPAAGTCAILLVLLIAGPPARRFLTAAAIAAGAVSLAGTLWVHYAVATDTAMSVAMSSTVLFELTALIWILILLVRHAPTPMIWFGCALTVPAQLATFFRGFHETSTAIGTLTGFLFWSIGSIAAVLGGMYLRSLDAGRAQEVRAAQQAQRMDLARDLHDYVAHDISGIVVQAQAARLVAEQNPAAVSDSLRRIEQSGQQALATMDRTVRMLRDPNAPEPTLGVGDLPTLVDRFGASGHRDDGEQEDHGGHADTPVNATLWMDPGLAEWLPHDVSATLYRVAVEGLTNVRRHAPDASTVTVSVEATPGGQARLTVRDDGSAAPSGAQHPGTGAGAGSGSGRRRNGTSVRPGGGLGLAGLRERVAALGGELDAHPADDGGWVLTARVPLDRGDADG